jgi:small-conductance mechanosensitive channel
VAIVFAFADPSKAVEVLGVKLVGVTAENGQKLLLTLALILILLTIGWFLSALADRLLQGRRNERVPFWTRQIVRIAVALLLILGVASIWFEDPTRLATAAGLVAAGLSFALQKVITAAAGYFVILRGKTFTVGDRIAMGGVRGDVIALDFIKTTIMEIGQPPSYTNAAASTWVRSRQYTGRVVSVTNDKVFSEPVYNYTRDFPYLWEEMSLPISYTADRRRAEQIILEVAGQHGVLAEALTDAERDEMEHLFSVSAGDLEPRVYYRLTDNWLELTVRFFAKERGVRDVKDVMSRDILQAFDEAGIGIASATFEIVGLPPLRVQRLPE